MILKSHESSSTSRTSRLGARGKRRDFSPVAATLPSQSARAYTHRFGNSKKSKIFFFDFFEFVQGWTRRLISKQKVQKNWTFPIFSKKLDQNSVGGKNLGSTGWTQIFQKFGFSLLNPNFLKQIGIQPPEPQKIGSRNQSIKTEVSTAYRGEFAKKKMHIRIKHTNTLTK